MSDFYIEFVLIFFAVESISNIDGSIFDDKSAVQKAREEKVTVQFLFHVKYEDFRLSQFYYSEMALSMSGVL